MTNMERRTSGNPLAVAMVTGLGWGLVFGLVDGVPVLSEPPVLIHLRIRLQTLAYLMGWYGTVSAILFALVGLIAWGITRLLHHEAKRIKLVAIYSGIFIGLVGLIVGLRSLDIPAGKLFDSDYVVSALVLIGLSSTLGVLAGLVTYGSIGWWQTGKGWLRPLRWKVVRTGVLALFLVIILGLSAVAFYRSYLRDLAIFQPKPSGYVATPEQPNIVLITIDTLRADHLGVYGYDPEISPNIDRLARQGVVFDQAIAQSSWTVPSVASFMTSLYPSELGIHFQRTLSVDMHIDPMRITLAEVLHGAGYRTQAYVANWLATADHGFAQGFDNFTGCNVEHLSFDRVALSGRSLIWLMCDQKGGIFRQEAVCESFDWGYGRLFDSPLVAKRDNDPRITEYGKRFLRRHKDERFFLWLHYMEPHTKYQPSRPFRPLPGEITPAREQFLRNIEFWDVDGEDVIRPVDLEALLSLYDGEIADADASVGEILAELERQGLTRRTVVILNADHGEEFYDHGGFNHGQSFYDELIRVPLIVSGPVVETPGRIVETQVRLLDLAPTVCEIAGVPASNEMRGRSLVSFLQGMEMEESPAFSEVLHTSVFRKNALRYGGYKLIYDVDGGEAELYHWQTDPREQVNLAAQEPEIVERMLAELETWMVQNMRTANELPRERPMSQTLSDETVRRLRDAGY